MAASFASAGAWGSAFGAADCAALAAAKREAFASFSSAICD